MTCDQKMVKELPLGNLKGASVASPWNENLSKVQHDSVPLEKEQAELFHTMTMQGLFLCKHGCPDIVPAIAYLSTWVQKPKLCRFDQAMSNVVISQANHEDKLTLRADSAGCLKWHCNTAFPIAQ